MNTIHTIHTTRPGRVIRQKFIARSDVMAHPNNIFVFGDNMCRTGYGGQAAAMRGFPNTIGVPTKWSPGMEERDFFTPDDAGNPMVLAAIAGAFAQMHALLAGGFNIVIPADGLGTGLSELPKRVPALFEVIESEIKKLEAMGGQEGGSRCLKS